MSEVTATFGQLSATAPVGVGKFVALGDVVAGGDGCGPGGGFVGDRDFSGIHPDTGEFVPLEGVINPGEEIVIVGNNGVNPTPVEESPFIDSVFLITIDSTLAINTEGVEFEFNPLDRDLDNRSWGLIMSNITFALFNPELEERIIVGTGENARTGFASCVGMHASAGVTFDLDALRETHGVEGFATLSGVFGPTSIVVEDGCNNFSQYVIFSDDEEIVQEAFRQEFFNGDPGVDVSLAIPKEARYVSLATGAANGCWCFDGSVFADVTLTPTAGGFKRGDDDADGVLTVGDSIFSLSFQFLGSVEPACLDALDFNDDNKIDVSDPVGNLSHQFLGQAPPAPPGKESCGADPTDDDLSCDGYPQELCN